MMNKNKAFTLIELMIVVAILSIIVTTVYSKFDMRQKHTNQTSSGYSVR